jgi:hypothetical protein
MAELGSGLNQVFGVACGLEKGKSTSGAKFDVVVGGGHALFSLYFRH